MVVLDRRARILFANRAMRQFEMEGILNLRHILSTYSQSHSRRLAELISAALLGAPVGTMSMPRPASGRLLTILVSSIRSRDLGRLSDAGLGDVAVMLFVVDPASRSSIPVAQMMNAYGLTQAEARVALTASSGSTIIETAQLLGLSPNTVKTHLRRVFAKTATGRQAELARLIAAIGGVRLVDTNDR